MKTKITLARCLLLLASAACTLLHAQSVSVLHNFGENNDDGGNPAAALIQGTDGNFYGTTANGGGSGFGTVFQMTPAGVLTTLASFSGANGNTPVGDLVLGSDGNFYGATEDGGAEGDGTVFQITPAGALTTLASFSFIGGNAAYPVAGVVQGSDGNFYGTTEAGGATNDGVLFKMTPDGTLTNLASFYDSSEGGLVQGSDGNFYGTTEFGGSNMQGSIFKITPAGVLTTLVSFNGVNGDGPVAALVQGNDGNFYGTTAYGGSGGYGTVFRVTPAGLLSTLLSFTGPNGALPVAPLTQGRDGNFYGTTSSGGSTYVSSTTRGNGTAFAITPTGNLITEISFNGPNGANPSAGLVQGSDGNFYGTTKTGGSSNLGVVFKASLPPVAVAPIFSPAAGSFASAQTVTIISVTTGATIRYTTDGSIPTETYGTIYSGPVTIAATTSLNAIAYKPGLTDSPVSTGSFAILPQVAAPVFTPGAGSYAFGQAVVISSATDGATIRYTTDGSIPTETNGTIYSGPVTLSSLITLQAVAYEAGYADSAVTSAAYSLPQVATPVLPEFGLFYGSGTVTITSATPGAAIRYTTDASLPTETHGTLYTGPVLVTNSIIILAIAYEPGYADSYVAQGSYHVYPLIGLTPPYFDPPPGAYVGAVTVTIGDEGPTIRYTTDGSTPSETHGTIYSGPISISQTTTFQAMAYGYGFSDSGVSTGTYTILPDWEARDFDGNGNADILWRNPSTGDFGIWTMENEVLFDGFTIFSITGFVPLGNVPPPWTIAAVGDFNHDGRPDILWRNPSTGEIGVMLMNGTTISGYVGLVVLDPSWTVAGVGDFNKDGETDILLQNTSIGAVGYCSLTGTTITNFTLLGGLPSPWVVAGVGDFNGDGTSNLLLSNPTTGELVIASTDGTSLLGFTSIGILPSSLSVCGVADFNNDGSGDLLVRDSAGDTGIWLMNGVTPGNLVPLGTVPAPWQPID